MRLTRTIILGAIFLLFTASKAVLTEPGLNLNQPVVSAKPSLPNNSIQRQKPNFFQRLLLKITGNSAATNESPTADKTANISLGLGIASWATLFLILIPTAVCLISIPLGIAAIITGNNALRNGTKKTTAARLGRGLGWGAIVGFAVLIIVAAIAVSSWDWN